METKEMSSEVENQEAQEATGTEEVKVASPAEEPTVPLHAHTALRGRAQAAEIEAAELRGKLSVIEEQQATKAPPAVSPIDSYIAKQKEEGADDDDIVINASLYQKQKVYESQVANEATANAAASDLAVAQATSLNAAKLVHEDWQKVIDDGQKLLTKGEHLDVTAAGKDFGEIAYAKCQAAIKRANPEKKTEAAPKKEESEPKPEEKKEEAKKEVAIKSQDEILANASDAAAKAFNL